MGCPGSTSLTQTDTFKYQNSGKKLGQEETDSSHFSRGFPAALCY